ncbi:FHA domain [Popillia japonica]|uniref:FHA domain n=1 Tax=Popillia japonica TaxID=7064 RepID=A0AAW1IZI7_POPJA
MANHYEVPTWAGKPPIGLHLDVLKGEKLIQKLMIDEKKCYLFGRNAQMNDFCIDHASCSRVHSALVYHKHLNRAFLVDLGSTHGTFIGNLRLEPYKPTQLPIDSGFHFGASTRSMGLLLEIYVWNLINQHSCQSILVFISALPRGII